MITLLVLKRKRARYPADCSDCLKVISIGDIIGYSAAPRLVVCESCLTSRIYEDRMEAYGNNYVRRSS